MMQYKIQVKTPMRSVVNGMLLFFLVLGFSSQIPIVMGIVTVILAMYCVWTYRATYFKKLNVQFLAILVLLVSSALFKLDHMGTSLFYLFLVLIVFFFAEIITRDIRAIYSITYKIYFFSIFLIYFFIYKYWGHKEPLGMIIPGSSTNGIPAYLIVIQIFLSLAVYSYKRKILVLTPLLTFSVAFFGSGRGSLVVAGLILVVSFIFSFFGDRSVGKYTRYFYRIIFVAVLALFVINIFEIFDYILRHTKLNVGLVDANRAQILHSYLEGITTREVLIGKSYIGTLIESNYNNNPHIAYVRLHSFFGIIPLLFVMISPFFFLFWKTTVKSFIMFFTFTSLLLLRAVTEPILFPTLFDVFYFGIFFLFIRFGRFESRSNVL